MGNNRCVESIVQSNVESPPSVACLNRIDNEVIACILHVGTCIVSLLSSYPFRVRISLKSLTLVWVKLDLGATWH